MFSFFLSLLFSLPSFLFVPLPRRGEQSSIWGFCRLCRSVSLGYFSKSSSESCTPSITCYPCPLPPPFCLDAGSALNPLHSMSKLLPGREIVPDHSLFPVDLRYSSYCVTCAFLYSFLNSVLHAFEEKGAWFLSWDLSHVLGKDGTKASGGSGKCRAVVNCPWLAAISLSITLCPHNLARCYGTGNQY